MASKSGASKSQRPKLQSNVGKIEKVECCVVSVPLDNVTSFSTRVVANRHYCLVRIRTEGGGEGIGFCYAGHAAGAVVATAVRELFAPILIGKDPMNVEGLWGRMYRESILHGRTGSVMRALSSIDIALWDCNARTAGLPLYKMLGSFAEGSVDAYASGGYYLDGKTDKKLGAELKAYVDQGFRAVKIKVGRLTPAKEGDRIAAARDAIGPDVLLMLDANNAWADLPTALTFMSRYEPQDPYWIEEPFSPDDIANHARLAERTNVLVATGEIEAGRWRCKELLDQRAAHILQTDAAVCGGVSEWRRIAATAASYGVTLSPHWFHDLHVHLVASTPNARFVEFFTDDQVLNFRRLIDRQLKLEKGRVVLPEGPGLDFRFDEKMVKKYALDRWS